MEKLICDKCGSDEVGMVCVSARPEDKKKEIKMTKWTPTTSQTLVYYYTTYKMTCKKCGFTHEVIQ